MSTQQIFLNRTPATPILIFLAKYLECSSGQQTTPTTGQFNSKIAFRKRLAERKKPKNKHRNYAHSSGIN